MIVVRDPMFVHGIGLAVGLSKLREAQLARKIEEWLLDEHNVVVDMEVSD